MLTKVCLFVYPTLVKACLPNRIGIHYEKAPPNISYMSLTWPIATPHYLASLRAGSTLYPQITHNAEQGCIEWENIPLKFRPKGTTRQLHRFSSDYISLEIKEPIELYELLKLTGQVKIELNHLFSGLKLIYLDPFESVSVHPCTILTNEFTLDFEEGLQLKSFSPHQHLHFSSVVLNEMRVADVIMLLEDKGFNLIEHGWQHPKQPSDLELREQVKERRYDIEASRTEGARQLDLYISIQGIDTGTTRERKVMGKAKYTTALPTGSTIISIQGKLQGDSKRAVNVINEIQKQLKEQFRHVGAVE